MNTIITMITAAAGTTDVTGGGQSGLWKMRLVTVIEIKNEKTMIISITASVRFVNVGSISISPLFSVVVDSREVRDTKG